MFNSLKSAFAGAAVLFIAAAVPANATEYVYSYTFDSSDTVTGSFTGTGPISAITNVADVTMTIDGKSYSGVSAYMYTGYMGPSGPNCDTCYTSNGAVVSSNPMAENFLFSDGTNYFYIIPWNNGPDNQVATQAVGPNGVIDSYNGSFIPTNFNVAAVPEPSTWTMMILGFGMVGFGMRSRRKQNARVTYA